MIDRVVLSVAKNAIMSRLNLQNSFDASDLITKYSFLNSDGASFVTINKNGNLRGCIGSIIAHRKLIDDIYNNAISAAFNDPRFSAVTKDELSDLTIEVSLLTTPKKLNFLDYYDLISKITPFKDGVILKYGKYQSTFLPQVWDQLPDPKDFLDHLANKAGLQGDIYNQNLEIYIYSVDSVEGAFDEIL